MFTQHESESEVQSTVAAAAGEAGAPAESSNTPEMTTFEVDSKRSPSAAKERHAEVVSETRRVMLSWICLLTINFMTHFMRMSVVMLYCIKRFDVSEFQVGLMASTHMLVMSVANSYMCYVIDSYSFESLMMVRFSLLTLATLGEYLADSFLMFAIIYCSASLAIVWFGVQSAYLIQSLPPVDAKELTSKGLLLNQVGVLVGLSLGGTVGGLISLRGVFLLSFIIAIISTLWIVVFLRGSEKRIKELQTLEIAGMYRDYPDTFNDDNHMFPMPFASQMNAGVNIHSAKQSRNNKVNNNNNNNENMNEDDYLDENEKDENEPMLASEEETNGNIETGLDMFSSAAIPFWILTLHNSLKTGLMSELVAWWNVYADQIFDANVSQSSAQCVIAIIIGIIVGGVCIVIIKHESLEFAVLLRWNTIVLTISSLAMTVAFLAVLPFLRFSDFWWAIPVLNVFFGITFGFPNTLQVFESPVEKVGKMFAAYIALRSAIPAVQHVIIGSLWAAGGHKWVFRWFGMMHFVCLLIALLYYYTRRDNPPKRGTRVSQFQLK